MGKTGSFYLTLQQCAYVEGFHTSVVSFKRLYKTGFRWDTEALAITWKKVPVFSTPMRFGQWVVEFNKLTMRQTVLAFWNSKQPRPIDAVPASLWHDRFGHIGAEALKHLPSEVQGVAFDTNDLKSHCETCLLSRSTEQPSRVPRTRSTTAYAKVHFDLITLGRVINGRTVQDSYILHFLEDKWGIHHVYHLLNKNQATLMNTIKHFANYVWRQYKLVVQMFMVDNESGLDDDWDEFIMEEGIKVDRSPANQHAQNGSIERAGGVITKRATALQVSSNLPDNLMAECYIAAGFLLNRTPMRRLGWRTPIGGFDEDRGVLDWKPKGIQIKTYGCKAYAYNHTLDKSLKTHPRAHIGWLVGYEASNIWRIWIPSLKTIISTRDVVFDESKRYLSTDVSEISEGDARKVVETIEVPSIDLQLEEELALEDYEISLEGENDSIQLWSEQLEREKGSLRRRPIPTLRNNEANQLISPEATPEPETSQQQAVPPAMNPSNSVDDTPVEESSLAPGKANNPQNSTETPRTPNNRPVRTTSAPKKRVPRMLADLQSNLVNTEPRGIKRKTPHPRNAVYMAMLDEICTDNEAIPGILAAFNAALDIDPVKKQRLHRSNLPTKPGSYKEMLKHLFKAEFTAAMAKEHGTLDDNLTWFSASEDEVNGNNVLPLMWVYDYKFDDDDYLVRFKARLVVRGDLQVKSLDDTYAATLAMRVFRCLMAIAAYFDLDITQMDAVNAFTNALIDEEVYCHAPEGFKQTHKFIKLNKALYGLAKSPKLWFDHLSGALKDRGFRQIPDARCCFTNGTLIVFFFVDDICILSRKEDREALDEFKASFHKAFKLKEEPEFKWFLKMRIMRDREKRLLWICQDSYIDHIVTKFNLQHQAPAETPIAEYTDLSPNEGVASAQEILAYQQRIGSIIYPSVITRPDIAYHASRLAAFMHNPSKHHQQIADRVIRYLNGTKFWALRLGGGTEAAVHVFGGSSDASFGDRAGRKSSEGRHFELFNGSIDWRTCKQSNVGRSTTEVELKAGSEAGVDLIWWKRVFAALDLDIDHTPFLAIDNLQTVGIINKSSDTLKTSLRHIDIHQHWLREAAQEGQIHVKWVPTAEMKADGFTKILGPQKHNNFRLQMNMEDIQRLIQPNNDST